MSDTFKRRRRRTGPSSARLTASQIVAAQDASRSQMGKVEIAASAAVVLVALALCALIWILALRAVHDDRAEARDRAEQTLTGQAATLAETVGHELQVIDQSLTILQDAWKNDSDSVDLNKFKAKMPALVSVADDLFIADDKHIIKQDILPQAIGQGVGSAYLNFPHGSLESFQPDGTKNQESLVLQGQSGAPIDAREFLTYIVRPLDHPHGWLIGASFRSAEITKLFAGASLGINSVAALVDSHKGTVQSVVGPSARHPKLDLSQSTLITLMSRAPAGAWTGETPIDGIERIHAFHRVPNRDMFVLVGAAVPEVMAPAERLAAGTRALAAAGTVLVLLIGALVLWELSALRARRRRQRVLERNRVEIERLRADDAAAAGRSQIGAARLQAVLENVADGIAVLDSGLRLVLWNRPFLLGIGVEPRAEMPLDAMLRGQVQSGMFGPCADVEAEVARRSGVLRAGDPEGLPLPGPNGERLVLLGVPGLQGEVVLLLQGAVGRHQLPETPVAVEIGGPVPAPDVAASAPVEW